MSDIQPLNPHNIRRQFTIGSVCYNPKEGLGAYGSDSSSFIAIIAPEKFLKIVSETDFPNVEHIKKYIESYNMIGAPYLRIGPNPVDDSCFRICGHEGRNRTKSIKDLFPNLPVPVFITTSEQLTPNQFAKLAKGAIREFSLEEIKGPLFRCFFHAGKRYDVVKKPNNEGKFDYSAKEVPYSRDICASV